MYEIYYILHIVGVALWIGSFMAFGFLLRSLVKQGSQIDHFTIVIKRIRLWVNVGVLPSALIVLLTGVGMILQFNRDSLPFYLQFMEQFGSLTILFTIVILTIYGRQLRKKLHGLTLKKEKSLAALSQIYSRYLFVSAILAGLVVIVVGLRLV